MINTHTLLLPYIKERKNDYEIQAVLDPLREILSNESIEDLIDEECIKNHHRLIGEYPSPESIMDLCRHQAFNEPHDYVSVHIKNTKYKSPINYIKALKVHMSLLMNQIIYRKKS